MKFLREMTFAMGMILLCLVGAIVLGVLDYKQYKSIQELRTALEPKTGLVENLVRSIQANSKVYSDLYRKRSDEGLKAQDEPTKYFREIAGHENIQIGRIEVDAREKDISKEIADNEFTITPYQKDADYSLTHIANFLWMLEDRSSRVRVTDLKIEALNSENPPKPRLKPHELPSDRWSFNCRVTSRYRKSGS